MTQPRPVHLRLYRVQGNLHSLRLRGQSLRLRAAQTIKHLQKHSAPGGFQFSRQPPPCARENLLRPLPVEDQFRSFLVRCFQIAPLRGGGIKRQNGDAAAALLRLPAVPLVIQKISKALRHERPKPIDFLSCRTKCLP